MLPPTLSSQRVLKYHLVQWLPILRSREPPGELFEKHIFPWPRRWDSVPLGLGLSQASGDVIHVGDPLHQSIFFLSRMKRRPSRISPLLLPPRVRGIARLTRVAAKPPLESETRKWIIHRRLNLYTRLSMSMSSSLQGEVGMARLSRVFHVQREVQATVDSGLWSHSVTIASKASANETKPCFYTFLYHAAFQNLLETGSSVRPGTTYPEPRN